VGGLDDASSYDNFAYSVGAPGKAKQSGTIYEEQVTLSISSSISNEYT
jgi:hypothetical protein